MHSLRNIGRKRFAAFARSEDDHRSEVTVGVRDALFEMADSFGLSDTVADDDYDGIAHGNPACVAWTRSTLLR